MRTLLKGLATAALLAFSAPLLADESVQPHLRGDISVSAPVVTVGDMFRDAGDAATRGLFRAPAPGTTGSVTLEQIRQAARAAGVVAFEADGIQAVSVSRIGTAIDRNLLEALIADDLAGRGILDQSMSMEIALDRPLPALYADTTEHPALLAMLRYMPGSSTFSARFTVAGHDAPLDVSGQIQLMVEAPHLVHSLPADSVLGADDVEMRRVPLNFAESSGLPSLEDVVGQQLQRGTRAGVMLRAADVAPPELIARNATVTVIYRDGPLTLTTRGKALNAASAAEPVSVLNEMTNKVLRGTATQNGAVAVNGGAAQVAGL